MTGAIVLALFLVVVAGPVRALLVRAQWTAIVPRAAILLWQAIAISVGIAILGVASRLRTLATPPANPRRPVSDFSRTVVSHSAARVTSTTVLFVTTVVLIVGTLVLCTFFARTLVTLQVRVRQRRLVDLVGEARDGAPGVFVVPHAATAAFSVPGLRSRLVVSRGAVDALSTAELAAVLAHEKAHVRARHDIALLPFHSLSATFPMSRALAAVSANVADLLEMAADDRAARACAPSAVAGALRAFAPCTPAAPLPGRSPHILARRLERIQTNTSSPRRQLLGAGIAVFIVLLFPIATLFVHARGV